MTRRHLIRFLAATTFCAALLPIASRADTHPARTPALRVGQLFRYDEDLSIRFLEVKNDSRCPFNATCVWQGDATVVLRIKAGNQPARNYELHTELEPNVLVIPANIFPPDMAGIPKSYVIRIARLSPLPTAGKTTRQRDYRLRLAIEVAQ